MAASQDAVASLEAQQKELKQRQMAIKKELKKKKQVEKRLMSKAANNLSQEQLLQVIAIKAAAKAKAKAAAAVRACLQSIPERVDTPSQGFFNKGETLFRSCGGRASAATIADGGVRRLS